MCECVSVWVCECRVFECMSVSECVEELAEVAIASVYERDAER